MQHHDYVCFPIQSFRVTGFLVAAVSTILWMNDDMKTKVSRQFGRVIGTGVVHQDQLSFEVRRYVSNRFRESPLSAVRRHHNYDFRH
jgi:hypothetical protein